MKGLVNIFLKYIISIILFLIYFLNAQINYFQSILTDLSKLNPTATTVTISESIDIGPCDCDLTPLSCDYKCCCDSDCPQSVVQTWINDQSNVCLNKRKLDLKFRRDDQ